MSGVIDLTVRLIRAGKRTYARKWGFLGVFVVVFLAHVGMLGSIGLLPEASSARAAAASAGRTATSTPVAAEMPTAIAIPAIGLSAGVANPMTTDVSVLDQALLHGAVHYPTSAKLGETGNVVLFGHSSYLPIVGNRSYKTFNDIQKLAPGDAVTVSSSDMAYTYRVRSVTKENANNAVIPLSVTGQVLTLSTCDSFSAKTDRFVVVADFVERHSTSSID